jgi:radical SAM protein with 4Fe4S-binding SPASM domain
MATRLVVVQQPSERPRPPRPRARGTKVSQVEDYKIRLHERGDRPWEGTPDDHRDRINVEQHGDQFVVYKPSVGALSAFNERDFIAFQLFIHTNGDRQAVARYFAGLGATPEAAAKIADRFVGRCVSAGWTRTARPEPSQERLQAAYFTPTRYCDRTCPYCYQGLNDRVHTEMTWEQIELVVSRIKETNPRCRIVVAGGEPFSHSRIRDILQLINDEGFPFVILTNGTYLDIETARFLKTLGGLATVQISLDGATAETHELTRGKGHFALVMRAIHNVIDQGLPFMLAPTVHSKNMHEVTAIADLAVKNGGWLSPNALKELPHAGLNYTNLELTQEQHSASLRAVNDHMVATYGLDLILQRAQEYAKGDPEVCSATQPNSTFICGMAHSLVDIDWNGDVYPCHLSKGPDLVIGNIFREDFAAIFQRVEDKHIRVMSYEIEQCSGCKFNSTCAGGCRAGAWFTYGTMEHPSDACEHSYLLQLDKLLIGGALHQTKPAPVVMGP